MNAHDLYVYFMSRALNDMAEIVEGLGDDLANRRMPTPGANSPYALLNHCLGAVDYWVGEVVAGRPANRDRDAEFAASGPTGPLLDRVRATVARMSDDVRGAHVRDRAGTDRSLPFVGPGEELDKGGALVHIYTEMVQHHGQLQIIRDALVAENAIN
jgi:hypothetical protein